jgi:hypothetical protein
MPSWCNGVLERLVSLKVEDSFSKVKDAFVVKGCKIVSEQPPTQIDFKQGSLWGIAPQTAKKIINVTFESENQATKVKISTELSSDWKNVTLFGCIFAVALIGLCAWIAVDLTGFRATLEPSFWSWIVTGDNTTDLAAAKAFINLTWGLAAFLSFVISLEVIIVVYVRYKIDSFAIEALP